MVSLFIGLYIYSYLCQFIYIQYIHTVHTYSNFILSGYSAGLVLIVIRIMYSMSASMASD